MEAEFQRNAENDILYTSVSQGYWEVPKDSEKWQEKYSEYLKTDRWKELKESCLSQRGRYCFLCPNPAYTAHHRKYPEFVFGTEDPSKDLTPICLPCHHLYHNPYPGLEEVRDQVMNASKGQKGCKCPVCEQRVKVYKRKLNSNMAATMCWIVGASKGTWVDVPKSAPRFVVRTNQYATIRFWDLIEQKPNYRDPTRRGSGIWRPTALGVSFVSQNAVVPKYVYLYNNKPLGFSDEQIGVREALGNKFSYEELLNESVSGIGNFWDK